MSQFSASINYKIKERNHLFQNLQNKIFLFFTREQGKYQSIGQKVVQYKKQSMQLTKQKKQQKRQGASMNVKRIYMQQNSPENPFGPNFKGLPQSTKISYKYSMAKQFIKLSSQDLMHRQIQQQRFLGILILGFVGGYFIAQIPRLIYSKIVNRTVNRGWTTVLSMCIFSSLGYLKAHQRYFQQVPKKFLDKYLSQAIENGFKDYQISKTQL